MPKPSRTSRSARPATDQKREALLQSLLAQVPFDGWTEEAYANAIKTCGLPAKEALALFPEGLRGCIDYFSDWVDAAVHQRIQGHRGFERMRVRDKVAFGVRARLEFLQPHREAARRLMLWYALPQHIPAAMKRTYKTVDAIWMEAGDTSTDYNFYTKRILLTAVSKSTMIYWMNDDSPGSAKTWEFLENRISDVMKLGKSISLLKEFKPAEIIDLMREKIGKVI